MAGQAKRSELYVLFWAQLFEGRLALNPGLNLTRVSFSFFEGAYRKRMDKFWAQISAGKEMTN